MLALAAQALAAGCSERSAPAAQSAAGRATEVSVRARLRTLRLLVAEAKRAELDAGGLLIDLGTGDQLKYTLGGWGNGWGTWKTQPDGATTAEVTTPSVPVRVLLADEDAPIRQVALRLRGRGGARAVSLQVDGKELGSAKLEATFQVVRLPAAAGRIAPGRRTLSLLFTGGSGVRADVDWIWLGRTAEGQPPGLHERVAPLTQGQRTRRALLAADARAYGFYLQVPPAASLVFDYGAAQPTRFVVRGRQDGQPPRVLFEATAEPGHWREGVVSLGALSGQAVRLDLATDGPAGPAGWGDPELMISGDHAGAEPPPAGTPARNVIVLVIDTARADLYKAFNAASTVKTPAFDQLAAESTVFTSSYASENWTKPSVATILSGLYPSTHGAKRDTDVLSGEVKLLSEHLQRQGFATGAFIANGYCSEKFGFRRGWNHYTNYIRENKRSDAEYVFADALAWVKKRERGQRFFLYLQTIDPHVPYDVPEAYRKLYHPEPYRGPLGPRVDGLEQAAISKGKKKIGPADLRWLRALYDAETSYHDAHMGEFFAGLRALGILDDTLVVVTNDHGEELGERGRFGHGHSLFDELIRSPLTIRYPRVFPPRQFSEITESVDQIPTIHEVLDAPAVADIDGVSLIPSVQGRPPSSPSYAISEFLDGYRAIRVGRWKLIGTAGGAGRLFDLEADPGETKDRAADALVARRLCELHLAEALETPAKAARFRGVSTPRKRFKPGMVERDPELRRQLEALGYFGGVK